MLTPQKMSRLKISHEAEGMFFVPKGLEDYRYPVTKVDDLRDHNGLLPEKLKRYVIMKLSRKESLDNNGNPTQGRPSRLRLTMTDEIGKTMKVYVFGAVWDWVKIAPGDMVSLYGEIKEFAGVPSMGNPSFVSAEQHGRLCPVYRHIAGSASSSTVSEAVSNALPMLKDATSLLCAGVGLKEREILDIAGFDTTESFFMALHQPHDEHLWKRACEAAHELAKTEILEKARRVKARPHSRASMFLANEDYALSPKLPTGFTLTNDQIVAIKEIVADLRSATPMMRLLSGDVGTGKTLTFSGVCAAVNVLGGKVAIVAPNEILVSQIVAEIASSFPDTPVVAITTAKKPDISSNPILVGTSALLHFAKKNKWVADLLVIDEQHKMSREQREHIAGTHTNILECTATAIPRSLALVTHGGMDVSILREAPVKREIKTVLASMSNRADVYAQVRDSLARGEQVAVVYAAVEDNEDKDAKETLSVESAAPLWESFAPGRVVAIHGKMKNDEKVEKINAMKQGEYDLMVCSTVIEVGITIPKLTTMLVVDPDRHGLAALHQLRGRLSRKGGDGVMILFPTAELTEKAYERMQAMVRTSDGFELSELDMLARGFGDLDVDSDEQNGEPKFCFRGIHLSIHELVQKERPKPSL